MTLSASGPIVATCCIDAHAPVLLLLLLGQLSTFSLWLHSVDRPVGVANIHGIIIFACVLLISKLIAKDLMGIYRVATCNWWVLILLSLWYLLCVRLGRSRDHYIGNQVNCTISISRYCNNDSCQTVPVPKKYSYGDSLSVLIRPDVSPWFANYVLYILGSLHLLFSVWMAAEYIAVNWPNFTLKLPDFLYTIRAQYVKI